MSRWEWLYRRMLDKVRETSFLSMSFLSVLFSGVVQKFFGRLFSCGTVCVTSKHAAIKAGIPFGRNSFLSTSFMRIGSNKGWSEFLGEGALLVVFCWLGYHFSSELQCEIIFFLFVIRSGTRPLWCASFTRMSFIENSINFATAKFLVDGILSAVRLAKLHFISRIVVLIALMDCARNFLSARFELLLAALFSQCVVSVRDRVYIHVILGQATSDIPLSCGWISSSCQLVLWTSNCCLGVLSWLCYPHNALLTLEHATLMAKTTCLTNSELLPSREWISLNSHWRCPARNCPLAKAIWVLLWEAKLTAMNRCGKNLFQITSIVLCFIGCLFHLHQIYYQNCIALMLPNYIVAIRC